MNFGGTKTFRLQQEQTDAHTRMWVIPRYRQSDVIPVRLQKKLKRWREGLPEAICWLEPSKASSRGGGDHRAAHFFCPAGCLPPSSSPSNWMQAQKELYLQQFGFQSRLPLNTLYMPLSA